jgi:iron complex outermembrane receptor protein
MSRESCLLQARWAALVLVSGISPLANAANNDNDEASGNAGLTEIVVTAQKRVENVQSVPIAISAFSAEALESRGVTNIAQISSFSPNIQIDRASPFAGSSSIISAYVRGIGQNDFAFNMEPGVGLYVDGVYYARTVGAAVDLLDVQRVEVLKGPQGTLFGRNTIGGAMSVITRDPGKEFAVQGDVTLGSFDRHDERGSIDIPLIDGKLYSMISFSSEQRDGYQHRIPFDPARVNVVNPITGAAYTGTTYQTDSPNFVRAVSNYSGSSTQGGQNSRTARAKLLFTPTDDFRLVIAADLTDAPEEANPDTFISSYATTPATLFGFIYNACLGGIPLDLGNGNVCTKARGTVGTSLASVAAHSLPLGNFFRTGNIDTSYATGSNFSDVRTFGTSATADWQLNDSLALKSITAYRRLESRFGTDVAATPTDMIDTSFTMGQKQVSEELQLNSTTFNQRLKSVVGAYYFTESGGLLDTVTFAEGLLQVYGPNSFKNDAWALFTHNNFAITDRLGATFGVRYTSETKYFTGGQSDLNDFANAFLGIPAPAFPDPANTELLFPTGQNKREFTNTSTRAGLEYQWTPDVLTYASFAQGYKSGGWTTRLAAPLAVSVAAGAPINPTRPPQFDPEKAATYELGVKSELLEHRLRVNGAAFWTNYTDMQVIAAPSFTFGAPWFFNAGAARIRGFELESNARVTTRLELNASVGFLDGRYTRLDPVALAGGMNLHDMLINLPRWTASLGGTYTVPLPRDRDAGVHFDYSFKDRMARDSFNTPELIAGSFGILNGSVFYGPDSGHWQLVLGVENLTDKRYLVTGNNNPSVGIISGTFSAPREAYVTVRFRQ